MLNEPANLVSTRRAMLALLPGISCFACRRESDASAVVYSSLDESYATDLLKAFAASGGGGARLVSDAESAKSTGLIARIIAEKSAPSCDVFLSGDVMRAAQLVRLGLAEPIPAGPDIRVSNHDHPEGLFRCFSARFRLIIRNQSLSAGEPPPRSVLDLAQPNFARRSCLANPLFGTTSMHAAELFLRHGQSVAESFFTDFSRYGGRMLASNGEVRRRVASGEFAYGLTDSDDVAVALRDRKPVDYLLTDQDGRGVVLVPSAVVQIRGSPQPIRGAALAHFLLSAESERILALSEAAHLAIRHPVPPPSVFGQNLAAMKSSLFPPDKLAAEMERLAAGFLANWVSEQSA